MPGWIYVIVIVALVVIALLYIANHRSSRKPRENNREDVGGTHPMPSAEDSKESGLPRFHYIRKQFLTQSEKQFLSALQTLRRYNLIVIPQVNLATVVKKTGDFRWQNELYRNIDFGVFDSGWNLLLLIELNDASHSQPQRQQRDTKVKHITRQAGIKLMTFYTNMPNRPQYVIDRIVQTLGVEAPAEISPILPA